LPTAGKWWRSALALVAVALWAPLAYVLLPLAGLLWLARPRQLPRLGLAAALTGVALWWLFMPGDPVAQMRRAALVSFTLVLLMAAWWKPGRYLPRAALGVVAASLITVVLVSAFGPSWRELTWLVARDTSISWRRVATLIAQDTPQLLALGDGVASAAAATLPATIALQSLAGGALAWHLASRLEPGGPATGLRRFRDFAFSDHLIWCVVLALLTVILPVATWIETTGLNIGIVAGVLYVVRGLAIAAVALDAGGVSVGAIVTVAILMVLLALPLLVIVPGLWVIGISDTWLDFRRRLAHAGTPPKRETD